jgi:hypothetical protein
LNAQICIPWFELRELKKSYYLILKRLFQFGVLRGFSPLIKGYHSSADFQKAVFNISDFYEPKKPKPAPKTPKNKKGDYSPSPLRRMVLSVSSMDSMISARLG